MRLCAAIMRPTATSLSPADADATATAASVNATIATRHLRAPAVGMVYNKDSTEFSAVSVASDCDDISIANAAN